MTAASNGIQLGRHSVFVDDEARSYRGNLIVFAEHVGNYSGDEILAGAA